MMRNWLGATGVAACLAAAVLWWYSDALAGGASDSKVKASAVASKVGEGGKQTVTVTLEIEKGWHIYANPVGLKNYEENRTLIQLKGKDRLTAEVKYPVGRVYTEGKSSFNIYEDKVVIPVQVLRTPGDSSPLRLSIEVSACKGSACLPPGTIELTVP